MVRLHELMLQLGYGYSFNLARLEPSLFNPAAAIIHNNVQNCIIRKVEIENNRVTCSSVTYNTAHCYRRSIAKA